MKLLVTGFGPFRDVLENPSALLAQDLAEAFPEVDCRILEVSWEEVNAFATGDFSGYDACLMLGISASAQTLLLEGVGRNQASPSSDVRGDVWGPGPLDPSAPALLATTLWQGRAPDPGGWEWSVDAGGYLCNALLFQMLLHQPNLPSGFIHVPSFDTVRRDLQKETLIRIVQPLIQTASCPRAT